MKCDQPALQDALLSQARAGALSSSAYVEHVATCVDCREALEFLNKARQRALPELSAAELMQLRLRVLPRVREQLGGGKSRRAPRATALLIFGLSVVSVAALAAYVRSRQERAPQLVAPAVAQSASSQRPPPEPGTAPLASAPVGDEPVAETVAPASRVAGSLKRDSKKSATTGLWSDAAESLKHDDLAGAERALTQLSADRDRANRDSARLSLAEIWIKQGQTARARAALSGLAQGSGAPAIRDRARALLVSLGR